VSVLAAARDDAYPGGPCPIVSGTPPGEQWAPLGTPPDGFEFMGAVPTRRCWMLPCPVCNVGWCPVVPDGTDHGYRLAAEIGCNAGCEAPDVAWCHLHQLGERPPREPVAPSEVDRLKVFGAARNATWRIVEARDPVARLKSEAYRLGEYAGGKGVDPHPAARVLAVAARHAGIPVETAVAAITSSILVGCARPRRAR
jgi:hypothetical protein